MSDLYDSLEDDDDERRSSSNSLDRNKFVSSDSIWRACESHPAEKYSFYLNRDEKRERENPLPIFNFSTTLPQKKLILPKISISTAEKGPEPTTNVLVDNKSLQEQGLQYNNDGSFTKSPRKVKEELPFITREYRNLQFQKKKTYSLAGRNKYEKKNLHGFTGGVESQVSRTQLVNARQKSGPNEELVITHSSLPTKRSNSKMEKTGHHNLTDAMKEKLLQTLKTTKGVESYKKMKEEVNINRKNENSQQNKIPTSRRKKTDSEDQQNISVKGTSQKTNSIRDKKSKESIPKIPKHKSDILLNAPRPRLNYSQRHQLECGFNPFFFRQMCKRCPDDSSRSNFGDSVMEEFPEVSSRVLSCDNLPNEEEERFYRQLIEKDKSLKFTQQSSRSEDPVDLLQMTGRNSFEGQKEIMSGRSDVKNKISSKSMYIDMPTEGNKSLTNTSKKYSHYCSVASSPNMSKVELALKGKTYGYMANARNIFKLKSHTEAKCSKTEREKAGKTADKWSKDSPDNSPTGCKLLKQNSLPVNGFPRVKSEPFRFGHNLPRTSVSLCKASKQLEMAEGSQKGFVLPQLKGADHKDGKVNAKLFERINSFLVSPNA